MLFSVASTIVAAAFYPIGAFATRIMAAIAATRAMTTDVSVSVTLMRSNVAAFAGRSHDPDVSVATILSAGSTRPNVGASRVAWEASEARCGLRISQLGSSTRAPFFGTLEAV